MDAVCAKLYLKETGLSDRFVVQAELDYRRTCIKSGDVERKSDKLNISATPANSKSNNVSNVVATKSQRPATRASYSRKKYRDHNSSIITISLCYFLICLWTLSYKRFSPMLPSRLIC